MENNENNVITEKKTNEKSVMICAYASLAISVILVLLWICNVGGLTVVTLETFVGVIVALLAIIVTIAIIWQIYNAIEMRNKIEELKRLEGRIKNQEKSLDIFQNETIAHLYEIAAALTYKNDYYSTAFSLCASSLECLLELDYSEEYESIDANLDVMTRIKEELTKDNINADDLEEIKKTNESIISLPNYKFIKDKYEPIYKEVLSKAKKEEGNE